MRQPVPFGKYLLLDRISVGGMAEVFKAKSYGVEGFEKIIAIKRILPTMGEDRDFIKMFIDEAKIAGQLAHANICQIFELGRIDGSHFIAMEYIWGKDLLQIQNRLRKIKQPMPIAMACFSIAKVLEGLDYAHRKRDPLGRPLEIVHRDCSPQNVLVSYEGEVKVIDFGIAKATSRNSRTMAGVLKGKFGYMSPEQVRGLPLDRRSDIFALGTMLYECLTGERLFQGETDFSTLEKVRNVDIRPPRELNPNIPEAVETVILKALSKDVDERYQWCSEMLADLQAFLMSQDVVFTAKSLSSWLKDVFSAEIDRERQLLEEYKRIGRDGLISGVPAADVKASVVETLGEAGQAEGDPTMLGGPNFDDMEQAAAAAAAAPEVGPAPGSPAARGGPPDHDDDDGEAFGEEAPTEIFGEIDHGAIPSASAPSGSSRGPGLPPPLTRPPRPPPAGPRPPGSRAEASQGLSGAPGLPGMPPTPASTAPGFAAQSYSGPASAGAPFSSPQNPGYGGSPSGPVPSGASAGSAPSGAQPPTGSQPIALGSPGSSPAPGPPTSGAGSGPQNRTLLGAAPPAGLPNYAHGYPPPYGSPSTGTGGQGPTILGAATQQPSGMQSPPGMPPHQGMAGMPGTQGPGMQSPGGMPAHPGAPAMQSGGMQGPPGMHPPTGMHAQMQGMQGMQGMHPSHVYSGTPYPPPPYVAPAKRNAAAAVEPNQGKRRSSIARDVAIGVAIAALVLGGFLAVKFLVLDDSPGEPSPPPSAIAMIQVSMASAMTADLFVDGKKVAIVIDKGEIPVNAGVRKVKLVGQTGAGCEQEMTLAAGKTTKLDCPMLAPGAAPGGGSSASPGAGSAATGSAATGSAATGSAATGSATLGASMAGAGSAADAGSATAAASPGGAGADGHKPPDPASGKPDSTASSAKPDPSDKPAKPDKPDRGPVDERSEAMGGKVPRNIDDTAKPARPGASTKLVETAPDRAPSKAPDKTRSAARSAVEDDPLGRLQGGAKPGDGKAGKTAEAKSYLNVTSKPNARIFIDNVDTGLSTPIGGRTLPVLAGKHKITFVVGNDKVAFSIVVKPGETFALHKDLQ